MNNSSSKRIILICRQSPYGNSISREAIEIALAGSVYEQNLAIIFSGDGIWQLLNNQDSSSIGYKNHQKLLSSFSLYDLNEVYVEEQALHKRNICEDELSLTAQILTTEQLSKLTDKADVILNF